MASMACFVMAASDVSMPDVVSLPFAGVNISFRKSCGEIRKASFHNAVMTTIGERIRQAREAIPMSQDALGEKIGVSRAAVSQWENNETEPRGKRLQELARVLNKSTAWLVDSTVSAEPEPAAPGFRDSPPLPPTNVGGLAPPPDIGSWPRDLPVYGTALGGIEEHGAFEFNMGEIIDHIRRPARLQGVKNAFAVFAVGESMLPRIRPGGPAIVHPGIAPTPGDDVLIELKPTADGEAHAGLIKRLVSRTETRIRVLQFNPPDDNIIIPIKRILRIYRIVPYEELLGY